VPAWGSGARRRIDDARERLLGLRSRLPPRVDAAAGRWPAVWPLVAVPLLVWLTWPIADVAPVIGLDGSWQAALHLAADRGVQFGPDLDFTYGPLGFLTVPRFYVGWTAVLGLLWNLLLQVGLVASVIYAARRTLTPLVAVGAAYVLALLLYDRAEAPSVVVFIWCCLAVEGRLGPRMARVVVPLGGVVIGLLTLVKLNVALGCLILGLIAAPFAPPRGWRSVGLFLGTFLAAAAAAWAATGNSFANVGLWVERSAQIIAGYSQALDLEDPSRGWEYAAFGVMTGLVFALLLWHARTLGRLRGAALMALFLVLAFLYWKHGFVRHAEHAVMTFAILAAVPVAIAWKGWTRVAAVALIGVGLGITFRSLGVPAGTVLDPTTGAGRFADQASLVVDGGERSQLVRNGRANGRRLLALDEGTVADLRGRTVAVWPHETSAIWAYGLTWDPLPIFQGYQAYTKALDQANIERIASADAPERILLHSGQNTYLDNHAGPWEAPGTVVAILCNYRQVRVQAQWRVLAKVPDRCGAPRRLRSFEARAGEEIPVPKARPGEMVVLRVHLDQTPLQRLRTLLYKPGAGPGLAVDGGAPFRILLASAGAGEPLQAWTPATVGLPLESGITVRARTMRLDFVDSPFRAEFDAIPVAPGRPASGSR
jgi:hypothetical protein